MTAEFKQRIHDAIEACRAIQSFTAQVSFDDYADNLMLRSAVERQFEILGEALNRASESNPAIQSALPDVPRIVGMRNRIIHGYDSVDDEIVWDAIQHHIPPLLSALPDILLSVE
jgi:uncharacterized protein with HEPN domain